MFFILINLFEVKYFKYSMTFEYHVTKTSANQIADVNLPIEINDSKL